MTRPGPRPGAACATGTGSRSCSAPPRARRTSGARRAPASRRSRGRSPGGCRAGGSRPRTRRSGPSSTIRSPYPAYSRNRFPRLVPPSNAFPVTAYRESRAALYASPPHPQTPPPPPRRLGTTSHCETPPVAMPTRKTLRDHLAVAVRARPEVERAVHGRQRPPDELAPEVGVDRDRPPGSLGSRGEVERVNPSERVGDVDRVRAEVDRRRAGHAVPVDLLADPLQLAELDPPAHVAVLGQRVEDALRRCDVDRPLPRPGHVLRHERLGADPPRERRVPGGPHRRRRQRGVRRRAPRQVVAVDEPAARRLSRGAATCEQEDERNREPGPPHEREC